MTPGNFFAEKTWNGSEKTVARIGAAPLLITSMTFWGSFMSLIALPTFAKLNFRLI
jgi:membrane protein YqaA with SNARE-associated domain